MKTKKQLEKEIEMLIEITKKCLACDGADYCRTHLFMLDRDRTTLTQTNEIIKLIEDVDIELLFTDIKDKDKNKVDLSDDVMEIIRIWWEYKSKELLTKIKGDGE